jgi:hypothetical protein
MPAVLIVRPYVRTGATLKPGGAAPPTDPNGDAEKPPCPHRRVFIKTARAWVLETKIRQWTK